MIHQGEVTIRTTRHGEMYDITEAVNRIVRDSGITAGIVNVLHLGSTGAVGLIEFEPGLQHDLPALLDRLIPPSREYGHEQAWHDGNGHSHLQATTLGQNITLPLRDSRLHLGTWQQLFFLECDIKPRTRTIVITILGD